jgi:hypothetical protein
LCAGVSEGIDFRMRIRENYRIANGQGQLDTIWRSFAQTRVHTPLAIPPPRRM